MWQSHYHVHHVTREEFEKKVQEQRKFDTLEASGLLDAEQSAKLTFSQRANELSTGKRALQAAAAIHNEIETEQSIAKVFVLHFHISLFSSLCTYRDVIKFYEFKQYLVNSY